jgi:Leucine-rich repeat (LRR) protein
LNSGKLTTIKPLDLAFLPSLRKIVLFGNQLRQLDAGDLHFLSPRVDLVDLSDNDLSSGIHQNAIQGRKHMILI